MSKLKKSALVKRIEELEFRMETQQVLITILCKDHVGIAKEDFHRMVDMATKHVMEAKIEEQIKEVLKGMDLDVEVAMAQVDEADMLPDALKAELKRKLEDIMSDEGDDHVKH